jgi:hypothetical protein
MAWGRVNTGGGGGGLPQFTYTGTYTLIDDGNKNWRIKFLTSGTFTPLQNITVDVFRVGGGGSGAYYSSNRAGGGSGYTNTSQSIVLLKNTQYLIEIGSGGTNTDGGNTVAFGVSANGGKAGGENKGGNGGSGGAASYSSTAVWAGGTDGTNGQSGQNGIGGQGQGTTTREFGEASGFLYANGGGIPTNAIERSANTGDGGECSTGNAVTAGASGIVVIRNHREVAA